MDERSASLPSLIGALPYTSRARRQYALIVHALDGMEELDAKGQLKETGRAVLRLLRAATDNLEEIIK